MYSFWTLIMRSVAISHFVLTRIFSLSTPKQHAFHDQRKCVLTPHNGRWSPFAVTEQRLKNCTFQSMSTNLSLCSKITGSAGLFGWFWALGFLLGHFSKSYLQSQQRKIFLFSNKHRSSPSACVLLRKRTLWNKTDDRILWDVTLEIQHYPQERNLQEWDKNWQWKLEMASTCLSPCWQSTIFYHTEKEWPSCEGAGEQCNSRCVFWKPES